MNRRDLLDRLRNSKTKRYHLDVMIHTINRCYHLYSREELLHFFFDLFASGFCYRLSGFPRNVYNFEGKSKSVQEKVQGKTWMVPTRS